MYDVECPYCESEQEICHDDGYEEDTYHEQTCSECDKSFVYQTSISFHYEASKADCLNGKPHEYKPTKTYPKKCTRMRCQDCGHERQCTAKEMQFILGG